MEIKKAEDNSLQRKLQNAIIVNQDFKNTFDEILLGVGISEPLDLNGFDTIFNFLIRNYGSFNLEMIKEAFDMYSAQKLDFKDSHYGSFDLTFIGKVLNSYNAKKNDERRKPKVFELPNPNPTSSEERERGFYWVNFIFLDESKRNGKKGEFPEIIICGWKDAYLHMIWKGMLKELTGIALTERLEEVESIRKREETNPRKRLANSITVKATGDNIKTMLFYKQEVCDWFIMNKERVLYEEKR